MAPNLRDRVLAAPAPGGSEISGPTLSSRAALAARTPRRVMGFEVMEK
jgi:hypothetical protein